MPPRKPTLAAGKKITDHRGAQMLRLQSPSGWS
jgi:hypothetical protein